MRTTLKALATVIPGASATYLIRDEFTDTVAAGSVDGTAATPGPGSRVVSDTESKVAVASDVLDWAEHTVDNQNSWVRWTPSVTRAPGVTVCFRVRQTDAGGSFFVTLDDVSTKPSPGVGQAQFRTQGPGNALRFVAGDLNNTNLGTNFVAQNTWAEYAIVLKTAGALLYQLIDGVWTLIVERSDGTDTTLHLTWANLSVAAQSSEGEMDYIRVTTAPPKGIPTPA